MTEEDQTRTLKIDMRIKVEPQRLTEEDQTQDERHERPGVHCTLINDNCTALLWKEQLSIKQIQLERENIKFHILSTTWSLFHQTMFFDDIFPNFWFSDPFWVLGRELICQIIQCTMSLEAGGTGLHRFMDVGRTNSF